MTKQRLWWSAFSAYAAAVFVVSVIPVPSAVRPPFPSFDKVIHLAMYLLLSWLLARTLLVSGVAWPRAMRAAVLTAICYGGAIELIQACLPYRDAEWLDLVANAVGGWLGTCCVSRCARESVHG